MTKHKVVPRCPLSVSLYDGFEALGENIEILWTLLPDRVDSQRGFFAQSSTAAARTIGHTAALGQLFEVFLLDVHLRADVCPSPTVRQSQARENPCLKLLPGVFGQEASTVTEFYFDVIEPPASPPVAVTVDAKDKYIRHPVITFHNLRNAYRFRRFPNTAKQRILANSNTCVSSAHGAKQPFE